MPSQKQKNQPPSSPAEPLVPEAHPPENLASTIPLRIKFEPETNSTPLSEEPLSRPSAEPEIAAPPVAAQSESQRRVRLQEAFRERGLDERNLAGQFAGVMSKLSDDATGSPKSHLDGLKEWIRVLADKASVPDDPPVTFQLIHSIPRPVREKPAAPPNIADDKEKSEN